MEATGQLKPKIEQPRNGDADNDILEENTPDNFTIAPVVVEWPQSESPRLHEVTSTPLQNGAHQVIRFASDPFSLALR